MDRLIKVSSQSLKKSLLYQGVIQGGWGSVGVAEEGFKKATKMSFILTSKEVEKHALNGEHFLRRGSRRTAPTSVRSFKGHSD